MKPRKASTLALLVGSFLVSAAPMTAQPATEAIDNWSSPPLWSPGELVARKASDADLAPLEEQAIQAVPTPPLSFVGIAPCRIVDTRGNGFTGAYGPPSLAAGVSRDFVLMGQCGIGGPAQAVSLNLTVTGPAGPGHILIYPTGGAQPSVSTLNYVAGQTIANAVVVTLGTGGAVTVVAAAATNLLLDTNGYYGGTVVTQVVAGTGMTGGGTGSIALGIANGGVGNAQLAGGSVSGDKIALPLFLQTLQAGPNVISAIHQGGGTGLLGSSPQGSGTGVNGQGAAVGVSGSSSAGVAVYGSGDNGVGVEGNSVGNGLAMKALGTASQQRDRGGWVKALVRMSGGALSRCFNSQATTRTGAESCTGFSITGAAGNYLLTFPFNVDDRYVQATAESSIAGSPGCCMVQYFFPAANQVRIITWDGNGFPLDRGFSVIVF